MGIIRMPRRKSYCDARESSAPAGATISLATLLIYRPTACPSTSGSQNVQDRVQEAPSGFLQFVLRKETQSFFR
jgi:hypothetical protein